MAKTPDFDLSAAHRHFAGACFNACWGLIDQAERSAEDEERMLRLAMTSHWHWTQREDCGPKEASVANWQVSRVLALMGEGGLARRYGRRALEVLDGAEAGPFYVGYAHEALARAEAVAGDAEAAAAHLAEAHRQAAQVEDADSRGWLEADLDTIPTP